jgi:hypothetical protein
MTRATPTSLLALFVLIAAPALLAETARDGYVAAFAREQTVRVALVADDAAATTLVDVHRHERTATTGASLGPG